MTQQLEGAAIAKQIMQQLGFDPEAQLKEYEVLKADIKKIYIELLNCRKLLVAVAKTLGVSVE